VNYVQKNIIEQYKDEGMYGDPWVILKAEMAGESYRIENTRDLARKNPKEPMNEVPLQELWTGRYKYPGLNSHCTII